MQYNNKTYIIITPILFAITLILGIFIGNSMDVTNSKDDLVLYPQVNKLDAVISYIDEEYVDSISKDDIIEKAIPIILQQLDPHSIYIPAKDLTEMNEPLEGNFDGIGVMFNIQNDTIMVINTVPKGPSEKVGVKAGDRIVFVNDSLVAGIGVNSNDVIRLLKGKRGTEVKVGVHRKGIKNVLSFNITRDKIPLESVDVAYMLTNNIGYIKVNKFARTTYNEFIDGVSKLKSQGMKKIVVDLRSNSGGYMDAATNIADLFLEKGKLIVYTQGRKRQKSETWATSRALLTNTAVTILIDEWSASASEILAGAIQDNDRGEIIGRRSFGKGLVQEPTFFSDGSGLRLTIARYYTPTGRCIQKPYSGDFKDYFNDIGSRYVHGEFSMKDSISFPDSLKYTTPKGKTVYGGGGIMPDYFIPVDTNGVSTFLTTVVSKGLVYKFSFNYTDKNRNVLVKYNDWKSLERYLDKQHLMQKFIVFVKENDIKVNMDDVNISKKLLLTHLKGYIARNIMDDEGFYPIIYKNDKTIKKAIEVLKAEK